MDLDQEYLFSSQNKIHIMAPGAIAAVDDWHRPGDSRDIHFADMITKMHKAALKIFKFSNR